MGCYFTFCIGLGIALVMITEMNTIIGGILWVAFAIFCFYASKKNKKNILNVEDTKTYKIKEIIELCNIVREELGREGRFGMIVGVEGTIKKLNYYSGLLYVKPKIGMKSVRAENKQFYVEDDTGQILVKTDKLDVFHDANFAYPQEDQPLSNTTIIGSIDGPVYVMGEASDASGELVIRNPRNKKGSFVVALKSKEQHFQHAESHPAIFMVLGIIALLCGLIFIGLGIAQELRVR